MDGAVYKGQFSSSRSVLKVLKALFRSSNSELVLPRWQHFENPRTFITMLLTSSSLCRFLWVQQDCSLCIPTAESLKIGILLHPLNGLISNPEVLGHAQPSSSYKGMNVWLRSCHLLNWPLLPILGSGWNGLAWFKKAFSLTCSCIKDQTFIEPANHLEIRRPNFFHPIANWRTLQVKFVHPRPYSGRSRYSRKYDIYIRK